MANRFGGDWTVKKLACLRRYLEAYAKVLKYQDHITTRYIDAFAGTGYVELSKGDPTLPDDWQEAEEGANVLLAGSATISLEVEPAFDTYTFIERSPTRADELEKLKAAYPARNIDIRQGDSNQILREICGRWNPNERAVLFLDPFGISVEWETLRAVATTKAIDVWYLVAVSAINRLMPRDGRPPLEWQPALERVFGTSEWVNEFYRPRRQPTLFDEPQDQVEKRTDWESLCGFLLARLRTLFHNGVAEHPLLLRNTTGSPLFLLCFAVSNPNPTAIGPALRIAEHILGMDQ